MHRACHCIYSHIPVPFFLPLSHCFARPPSLSARPLKLWHFRFPGDRACQAVAIATPCSLRPAQHQPTPLPHITPYPIARMWGLQRESTPAGFLLIGYFSFALLPCFCLNFLPPLLDCLSFLTFVCIASHPLWIWFLTLYCSLLNSLFSHLYKHPVLLLPLLLIEPEHNLQHLSLVFIWPCQFLPFLPLYFTV